jgi:hypothetical protein
MGVLTINMAGRMSGLLVEYPAMPAIVDFPTLVKKVLAQFGGLFKNEPERVHFAEYLTGLLVANKKNICGIHRKFAVTTGPLEGFNNTVSRIIHRACGIRSLDYLFLKLRQESLDFVPQK